MYQHSFGIAQKEDPKLLSIIGILLNIRAKVLYYKKKNYYILKTASSQSIEYIIDYFSSNDDSIFYFKSVKALDFFIWQRSYKRFKGNYKVLRRVQACMQKLKTILYILKA